MSLKRKDSRLRDWKQDNSNRHRYLPSQLEKKRFSITRLKRVSAPPRQSQFSELEKKRFSITRLKQSRWGLFDQRRNACLKRKDSRLRDWNLLTLSSALGVGGATWKEKILDYEIETSQPQLSCALPSSPWKEKILDYEIETRPPAQPWQSRFPTWKEKILDYEIETKLQMSVRLIFFDLKRKDSRLRDWNWEGKLSEWDCLGVLEKKRFSITRLKQSFFFTPDASSAKLEKKRFSITRLKRCFSPRLRHIICAWKEKILDYEIETGLTFEATHPPTNTLEKKRFSITRLKHWNSCGIRFLTGVLAASWKEKILDYEIETTMAYPMMPNPQPTWKEKILDYEIETLICIFTTIIPL